MTKTPELPSLKGQPWLMDPQLQGLLRALGRDKARIVGGAVRNALLGEVVEDVDIATAWPPQEAMRLAKEAGFAVHPVALDHGSVIVSRRGRAFEVTTLRRDVETDGRHAKVAFTADWAADAARRDFTMNALYADAAGHVFDPLGGYGDLMARRVRFIGDARARIGEDYLRILRFFRFWARYGADAPDAEALAACEAERAGLGRISRERIRAEISRLLVAPRAVEAVLFMAGTGVDGQVFPAACEGDRMALARMALDDERFGLAADWLLRLCALCGPGEQLRDAFRLSRAESRVVAQLGALAVPGDGNWRAFIYRHGNDAACGAARLAHARGALGDADFAALVKLAKEWTAPVFPLRGTDALAAGVAPGARVGQILRKVEERWLAQGFVPEGREGLLALLARVIEEEGA